MHASHIIQILAALQPYFRQELVNWLTHETTKFYSRTGQRAVVGELAPPLLCVRWPSRGVEGLESRDVCPIHPNPLSPEAVRRADPKVMRVDEHLTNGSTQESRSCTSSGQHKRAAPGRAGTDEPVPSVRLRESWPHHLSEVA